MQKVNISMLLHPMCILQCLQSHSKCVTTSSERAIFPRLLVYFAYMPEIAIKCNGS